MFLLPGFLFFMSLKLIFNAGGLQDLTTCLLSYFTEKAVWHGPSLIWLLSDTVTVCNVYYLTQSLSDIVTVWHRHSLTQSLSDMFTVWNGCSNVDLGSACKTKQFIGFFCPGFNSLKHTFLIHSLNSSVNSQQSQETFLNTVIILNVVCIVCNLVSMCYLSTRYRTVCIILWKRSVPFWGLFYRTCGFNGLVC